MKVVFTDSGLGGITIMADFVHRAKKKGIPVDVVFFNAQYRHDLGYKKMDSAKQIEIFNRALQAMETKYQPDILAIACNTLSVVYRRTPFYKESTTKVFDIINVGQELIEKCTSELIIEVAMPTTIVSQVYRNETKKMISVASNTGLPGAIEKGDTSLIEKYLNEIFSEIKQEFDCQNLSPKSIGLFLGCTHFPIVKDQFVSIAKQHGIDVTRVLNPNLEFSENVLSFFRKKRNEQSHMISCDVQVISRTNFTDIEVKNMSGMLQKVSPKVSKALRNYKLDLDLF